MRSYDQLVSEGRAAVRQEQDAKWRLGDLALEVEPLGGDHARTNALARLDEYAAEIGISLEALRQYRTVSAAWPDGTRVPSASWTAHRELMGHPDRASLLKPGMTVNQARQKAGLKAQGNERPRTTQEKVEAVREFMADPEVATAAAADKAVRSSFAKASDDVFDEVHDRQREKVPAIGRIEDAEAVAEAMVLFSRYRRQLTSVMGALKSESLTEDERDALEEAGTKAKNATDLFLDSLKKRDWDLALAALNGEVE